MLVPSAFFNVSQTPSHETEHGACRLLWLFGKNQSCTESISLWQVQIREGCPPAALALQTSVGFHRVIGHSKALCKAIHYTPAAPRVPWQIAHPFNHWSFRATALPRYFALFINTPPAFQPSHLLPGIQILGVSADTFGALTSAIILWDPVYLLHFVLLIPFLFCAIQCPKTPRSKDYSQLFIFTECTCQSWHCSKLSQELSCQSNTIISSITKFHLFVIPLENFSLFFYPLPQGSWGASYNV